jgi:hypothetical protein
VTWFWLLQVEWNAVAPGVNGTGRLARRRRLERFDLVSDRAAEQAALTDVAGVGPAAEPGRTEACRASRLA